LCIQQVGIKDEGFSQNMFDETNWKTIGAELLGTFFLVFFGVTAVINGPNSTEENPITDELMLIFALKGLITLGLTLMVLVHILGPVSGCHLNPVITIPTLLSGKMSRDDAVAYIGAQIIGATAGFVLFGKLFPSNGSELDLLIFAMIGTTFFVTSLITSQDPASIGATLFVVSSNVFGDVNPGISLGNMIAITVDGGTDWAFFGIVGSLLGCLWGWLIKENIIDR
jgi:glycerol uptake facilitator-like aquaporin